MSGISARADAFRREVLALLAGCGLSLALAAPARAGTYDVIADGDQVCGLLRHVDIDSIPGFSYQCLDPTG